MAEAGLPGRVLQDAEARAHTEEQALSVLATEFNPRCDPPWNEAELLHKLRCARNAGRVAIGSLLDTARK